jgi:hypothetical protein
VNSPVVVNDIWETVKSTDSQQAEDDAAKKVREAEQEHVKRELIALSNADLKIRPDDRISKKAAVEAFYASVTAKVSAKSASSPKPELGATRDKTIMRKTIGAATPMAHFFPKGTRRRTIIIITTL